MSVNKIRAWHFVHPDLDEPDPHAAAAGRASVAGLRVSPVGGIALVDDADAVRQALLLLLSTMPGERVMRPTYGCELFRVAFSPNDDTTAGLAMHYVRRAIERFEPRVEIVDLDAGANPDDPTRLDVTLDYRVRPTRQRDTLVLTVPLAGDGA